MAWSDAARRAAAEARRAHAKPKSISWGDARKTIQSALGIKSPAPMPKSDLKKILNHYTNLLSSPGGTAQQRAGWKKAAREIAYNKLKLTKAKKLK